jgi:hypothetical protein
MPDNDKQHRWTWMCPCEICEGNVPTVEEPDYPVVLDADIWEGNSVEL